MGQPSPNLVTAESLFTWDGLGRRRRDQEMLYDSSGNVIRTPPAQAPTDTLYVYDGMNVVRELDNTQVGQPVTAEYVWAGGIGQLLSRTVYGTPNTSYYYHYDGRGNVAGLTDSSQNIAAYYTYDAFGNTTASGGPQVGQPFGYSTKWKHSQTGLLDYGFRFYNPAQGTWINRDPIEEAGGANLYAFVGNSPTNRLDREGLQSEDPYAAYMREQDQQRDDNEKRDEERREMNSSPGWVPGEGGGRPSSGGVADPFGAVEGVFEKIEAEFDESNECLPCEQAQEQTEREIQDSACGPEPEEPLQRMNGDRRKVTDDPETVLENRDDISYSRSKYLKWGKPDKIRSEEKSNQNRDNALKQIMRNHNSR